jgi:hypothetical protein
MDATDIRIQQRNTPKELSLRTDISSKLRDCPIPGPELLENLGLFINRKALSRMLFMHELYMKIIQVHGVVMEFGVRWGQNLALFESFRGMYEPYNHYRKIIGFDTFEGFPTVDPKDGVHEIASVGAYSVTDGYQDYLQELLEYHEQESPISHIRKFELVCGDASRTIDEYLGEHPETIIALAYFDMDLYEPTRKCLEAIKHHLVKGSVIGFDQLNSGDFPGETLAFHEILGLRNHRLQRSPLSPGTSYIVIE